MESRWPVEWIDSEEGLSSIVSGLLSENFLSIDTETVGWETGNERLCLIQIGVPSRKMVYVIDPLSITNLGILEPILIGTTPLLVAHNAPFEVRQFERHKIKLRGVVDTLEMSRRLRQDLPNHTLQTCCRQILGVDISKVEQTSDWSRRPLTPSQLQYAALDAEITVALYNVLKEMEDKLHVDEKTPVPELMRLLAETVKERLILTKEIAPHLGLLQARDDLLRERIRARLIEGEPAYEGEFGKCSVSRIKRTEISAHKIRSIFPEIADRVISEMVDRKRLTAVMKEYGIPSERIDEVSDVTGYTDRMALSVKDIS